MIIGTEEQRSTAWFEARCGWPSASGFDKIITTAGKRSEQRQKYMYQLAGEAVSGQAEEGFQSNAMLRGIEMEAEAKQYYSFITGYEVQEVGFCMSDDKLYGCSPDGLIGEDGLIEIKCPLKATHVKYLLDNKLPTEYFQQVHGEMLITGRRWCDFVSYSPGLKPFILRVHRDESFLKLLELELRCFCKELELIIEKIK